MAKVPGRRPPADTNEGGDDHRSDADEQREAAPVEDQAEDVVAVVRVSPEQVTQGWPLAGIEQRILVWGLDEVGKNQVPDWGPVADDDDEQERQGGPLCGGVVHEPPVGQLAEAELLDGDVLARVGDGA